MLATRLILALAMAACPPTKQEKSSSSDGEIVVVRIGGERAQASPPGAIKLGISEPPGTLNLDPVILRVPGGERRIKVIGSPMVMAGDLRVAPVASIIPRVIHGVGAPIASIMLAKGPTGDLEVGGPWLGVRFGPVPKPLATHLRLKESVGQMILNVVRGSPADEIGLRQYDVILKIDDDYVDSDVGEFVEMVRGFEVGNTYEITYFQRGDKKTGDIEIGERPDEVGEYKYEVAPEETVQSRIFRRGGMLEKDDDGNWVFRGLNLDELPKLDLKLKELEGLDDLEGLKRLHDFDFHFDIGEGGVRALPFSMRNFQHKSAAGESISIQVDDDGKITVTRTESDGDEKKTTTKEYESWEELAKDDPEAVKLHKGGAMFRFGAGPFGKDGKGGFAWTMPFDFDDDFAEDLQAQIREQIETNIGKAPQDLAENIRKRLQQRAGRGFGPFGPLTRPRTSFELTSNGEIRVTIRQGPEELVQTFKNKNDLKKRRPELYKRFQKLQNGDGR